MTDDQRRPDHDPGEPADAAFRPGAQPPASHDAEETQAFARPDLSGSHDDSATSEQPAVAGAAGAGAGAYASPYDDDFFGGPPPAHEAGTDREARKQRKRERRAGRRRGLAVVAATVLLGGAAGFGGAAAYDRLGSDTETVGTSEGGVTTQVVDSGATAAAPRSVQAVADSVLPSVVQVLVTSGDAQGSGSGIVLTPDGTILTNAHVVDGAGADAELVVSFNDGSTAPATIVGEDPVTDIAVIKAEGVDDLEAATLGRSDNLRVGQNVVAIGSPFGLSSTVTTGIVSALDRPVAVGQVSSSSDLSTIYPAIQTDAAINPGNSGGPLVNLNGEVVGINSSIRTSGSALGGQSGSIGLGFAIPLDEVSPIISQIRNGEEPTHARIGITVSDAISDAGLPRGAEVQTVVAGSPGAAAGLEEGDIITELDGTPVDGSDSLVAQIRSLRPGEEVTLTILRGGDTQDVRATLASDADPA